MVYLNIKILTVFKLIDDIPSLAYFPSFSILARCQATCGLFLSMSHYFCC